MMQRMILLGVLIATVLLAGCTDGDYQSNREQTLSKTEPRCRTRCGESIQR